MRIAQVAPLTEPVPPKLYGGTERVVSWLTEELVRQGHEVTLFASGDSQTAAELVTVCEKGLRLDENCKDPFAKHVMLITEVSKRSRQFDIIHSHLDYFMFPYLRHSTVRSVHTLHGRLDLPDLKPLYEEYSDMPLVSISNHQRRPIGGANWAATVYHGLPADMYSFTAKPSDYLLFLGRICRDKRPDRAIEIAKQTGMKLIIAAKVDPVDRKYFESEIKPLLDPSFVDYIGEVNDSQKNELLGNAKALLFPIDWPEPFGLVMIESMACGTPIVAFDCGSVEEIIIDGVNGFKVKTMEEAIRAVENIEMIDRQGVRDCFDLRYTSKRMAEAYVELYTQILDPNAEIHSLVPFSDKVRRPVLKK